MILRLVRLAYMPFGTYGLLEVPGGLQLVTVEAPWRGNRVSESCIPEGRYRLVPGWYNRGGYETWEIPDGEVPGGRTEIKMHMANWPRDVTGCIGLGTRFGVLPRRPEHWAALNSGRALRLFLDSMEGAQWVRLEVTSY